MQVVDTRYVYEDYLMDFDRQAYRECLAGLPQENKNYFLPSIISQNAKRHDANWVTKDNRDLLYCRLNGEFRNCMSQQEKEMKFSHLESGQSFSGAESQAHRQAFQLCKNKGLTPTEASFYRHVLLGEELDRSQISSSQAQRLSGDRYAFEDYLKFYDRYTYRECFMNPAGLEAFKDSRDMIMYARLNIDFRLCMGKPILKHRYTGGLLGSDREATYEKCKDGVYNPNTFRNEGRLSQTEKYFYETQILKRNVRFEELN